MTPDPNRLAKFTSKSGRHFLNANGPSFNTHSVTTHCLHTVQYKYSPSGPITLRTVRALIFIPIHVKK